MTQPPRLPCPNCRDLMPPGFNFCRPCAHELPFNLRVDISTAEVRDHFHQTFPSGPEQFKQALAAALSHLRQHSTAVLA